MSENQEIEHDEDETNLLERMDTIMAEMKEQSERFELLERSPELTPQVVMAEMRSTMLSFMMDVASTSFEALMNLQEDVETLMDDADPVATEVESQLTPEDAREFTELLSQAAAMMSAAMMAPEVSNEQRVILRSQIERMERALVLIKEITIPEEAEEEQNDSTPPESGTGATLS